MTFAKSSKYWMDLLGDMNFNFNIIFYLVFFFVYLGEMSAQTNSEINNPDSGLVFNQIMNDTIYHAGVVLVLDLNGKAQYTKSSFCLSCHDGIFVRSGHTDSNVGNPENIKQENIFRGDHPVAFDYGSGLYLNKDFLNDPYNTPSGFGGTVADDLLVEGRIECVTCHSIIFRDGEKEKYEILVKSNGGSALCLTCHNR